MKILIRCQYKNADYGAYVKEISEADLPYKIQGMSCDPLKSLPKPGQIFELGLSEPHFFPSDVLVCLATEEIEKEINRINNMPTDDLIDHAESYEDLYRNEIEIRNYLVGKIADNYLSAMADNDEIDLKKNIKYSFSFKGWSL